MLINLEHNLRKITTCIWKEQDCGKTANSGTQLIFTGPFKTAVPFATFFGSRKICIF